MLQDPLKGIINYRKTPTGADIIGQFFLKNSEIQDITQKRGIFWLQKRYRSGLRKEIDYMQFLYPTG